ncbi:MAG: iron-containing alcohol dehydrogenase [Bacteroidales bacterium]|nr:iron-containing alcohol dehydrogenase [Bacteroidales bacterium]
METFIAYNPTKLFFGKQSIEYLSKHLPRIGQKALLVFGGKSAKANGAYDDVIAQLIKAQIRFVEFWGIKPNPRVEEVREAIALGIKEKVDMVIAVGGGSVIDSAKIIALCIPKNNDPWNVMKGKEKPTHALPIITVLTLAATGSEMNPFAVLQNNETNEKLGFGSPFTYPTISICDPTYTLTVSKEYTAYGLADIVAHLLEAYFGDGNALLSDRFVISVLKEVSQIAELLLSDLQNYELRERMMWASTCALNGITFHGRKSGDWGVHDVAHHLSVLFDIPHGASLSVVYPAWLKLHRRKLNQRIIWLGNEWWGIKTTSKTIKQIEDFFLAINCPIRFNDLNLDLNQQKTFESLLMKNKPTGMIHRLTRAQLRKMMHFMK